MGFTSGDMADHFTSAGAVVFGISFAVALWGTSPLAPSVWPQPGEL